MPEREGTLVAGRYRVIGRLGSGGMGVVWRATDEFLEREVALKEVHATVDFQRTLREARAAARLSHRGIVTVHDVVVEGELPWIVMELVAGGSLAELVTWNGPLPDNRVTSIAVQVLAALTAAHDRGILHRDVKPANVLISPDRVVLTDFGIAAVEGGTDLTATNQLIGSPQYLAPERINGRPAEPASDLWALGVTLYYALAGHTPFEREDAGAVLAAILTTDPAPLAGPLWPVIAGLLHRDPAERLTATEATALLTAARDATPVATPQAETAATATIAEPAEDATVAAPRRAVTPAARGRRTRVLIAAVVVAALIVAAAWTFGPGRVTAGTAAPVTPADGFFLRQGTGYSVAVPEHWPWISDGYWVSGPEELPGPEVSMTVGHVDDPAPTLVEQLEAQEAQRRATWPADGYYERRRLDDFGSTAVVEYSAKTEDGYVRELIRVVRGDSGELYYLALAVTDDELHTLTPYWNRNQVLFNTVVSAFRVGHPA